MPASHGGSDPMDANKETRMTSKTAAPAPDSAAFGAAFGEVWKGLPGMNLPVDTLTQLQKDYVSQASSIWNDALGRIGPDGQHAAPAKLGDRRFAAEAWARHPMAALAAQTYLLNARTLMQLADAVQADDKTRAR
ncbi:MAG: hypothetical protein HY021_01150, partial [Burkholderiales bacterium]|nr:hypothetical protein [Burkholderiales bacterium]